MKNNMKKILPIAVIMLMFAVSAAQASEITGTLSTGGVDPATPTGLTTSNPSQGDTKITISWNNSVVSVGGYNLYRITGANPAVFVASITGTSYLDTGLSDGSYSYQVESYLGSFVSDKSALTPPVTIDTTIPATNNNNNNASSGGGGGGWVADTTPPTNTSVLINGGDTSTDSTEVVLTLSATGASKMMIASSSDFAGANWESYATQKNWTLVGDNGVKTVYAKFKDAANNASSPTQDTITLTIPDDKTIVKGVESDWRTVQLQRISEDAGVVYKGDANLTCGQVGVERNAAGERNVYDKYTVPLISGVSGLADNHIYAITNFVFCGTNTTLILGEGERAGVINSYKAAFGKLPATRSEWEDVIKIANGRWPSERSETAETRAKQAFEKVYLRAADMNNQNDNAAVTIIAYGLRPDIRNLDSEKIAIKTFKAIYGYNPVSAIDWDITRAIAYSGAVR